MAKKKTVRKRTKATAKKSAAASKRAAKASSDAQQRAALERIQSDKKRAQATLKALRESEKRIKESLKRSNQSAASRVEAVKRFQLVDSKSRRYLDRQTGETISRREQVKRSSGGRSPEQKALDNSLQRARGRDTAEGREKALRETDRRGRLKTFGQAYKERKAAELGVRPEDIKIRGDSDTAREFKTLSRGVERLRKKVRNGQGSKAEIKAYVNALIIMGVISVNSRAEWERHYYALQNT